VANILKVPFASVELLNVAISTLLGSPTSFDVQVGLSTDLEQPPGAFVAAAWDPGGQIIAELDGQYQKADVAQILVSNDTGPGDLKFTAIGDYFVWVKLSDQGDQAIIRPAGKIKVT
jgi:hypothetical protein